MRISTNELDGKTLNMKMFNEESRCYLIYMNVQTRVDMAIVVDEMLNDNRDGIVVTIRCFNGMSLDVSLYSKILQRIRLDEERVRLLVGSSGPSTTPSYSPGPSTTLSYSPGLSTPPSYSSGPSRNAECANCKLLIGKLKVLEATLEMYMHSENHTIDSTALLHELYNDMGKFILD
ncbi:hypothetical protein Tco_1337579 [Tanacetum coccineum]